MPITTQGVPLDHEVPFPRRLVRYEFKHHRMHHSSVQGMWVCALILVTLIPYSVASELWDSDIVLRLLLMGMLAGMILFFYLSWKLNRSMPHHSPLWCVHCLAHEGPAPRWIGLYHHMNARHGFVITLILCVAGVLIALVGLWGSIIYSLVGCSLSVVASVLRSEATRQHPRWRTHCSLCPDHIREQASMEVHQAREQVG